MSEAGGDPSRRRLPAIKDLADTAGIRTTRALRATAPASAGFIVLEKTNTLEFASGSTNPVRLRSATTNRATPRFATARSKQCPTAGPTWRRLSRGAGGQGVAPVRRGR